MHADAGKDERGIHEVQKEVKQQNAWKRDREEPIGRNEQISSGRAQDADRLRDWRLQVGRREGESDADRQEYRGGPLQTRHKDWYFLNHKSQLCRRSIEQTVNVRRSGRRIFPRRPHAPSCSPTARDLGRLRDGSLLLQTPACLAH
jgi:hypothetical protein